MMTLIPSLDTNAHALFEQAPALINILRGRDGVCELFNPPLAKWWGNRQVIGLPMRQAWPELHASGIFEIVEKVYDTNETVYLNEFRAAWEKNGTTHENFFNFVFAPYKESDQTVGVMIFGHDVTDIVLARKKVEESRKDLIQLADAMPQLVWIMDAGGKVTYYNKRIWEFGFHSAEGYNVEVLESILHPDDLAETHQLMKECLRTSRPFEIEHRLKMKDGEYRWHLTRAIPEMISHGQVQKWFATATDIHKQKTLEGNLEALVRQRTKALEESNQKLTESNKNLEQFAYVVSHDLQAPLRKVKSFGDVLKNKYLTNADVEALNTVKRMQDSADRMKHLMDGVLEYSKLSTQETQPQRLDLNEIVRGVMTDFELVIKSKQAKIHVAKLHDVTGNAIQFRQVFQNLISNALKFSRDGVAPLISISSLISQEGRLLQIDITDNGVGFSTDYSEKVFELFQRAHGQHEFEGTGIGLSIVKKIIEKHGGRIHAASEEGKGTTFTILLPLI